MLTFALGAAEQALNETAPHTVTKLVEGRNKRIKLIEQMSQGRLKDIAQRSADLCNGNTIQLEGFQAKAIENRKIAADMSKAAAEKLKSLLTF